MSTSDRTTTEDSGFAHHALRGGTPKARADAPTRPAVWLGALAALLIGLTLRAPITSLAVVLPDIRDHFSLNAVLAGALTTVPLVAFVLFALPSPGFGRRFGPARAILAALIVIAVGTTLRLIDSLSALLIGMAVVGVGITVGNVLLPSYIKATYPDRFGLVNGFYSVSLYIGPALTAVATAPIAAATGSWRFGLFAWIALILLAVPFWLPHVGGEVSRRRGATEVGTSAPRIAGDTDSGASGRVVRDRSEPASVWRQPLTWAVTVYFAVLSSLFYTVTAWLPTILTDHGATPVHAEWSLTAVNLAAAPCALGVAMGVVKMRNQIIPAVVASGLLATGLLGMASGSGAVLWWSVVFGIGHGTATGVAYSLPLLRTQTARATATLGAISQVAGYSLSAVGPLAAGFLHDATGSWGPLLTILVVMCVVQGVAGIRAGRRGTVD